MCQPLKKHLLVVEDDDGYRASIRSDLRHMDYEITAAATVSAGLAALDPPPDCVLLDLTLPDGPGEAILEKIRARDLPSRVVVCTEIDDRHSLERIEKLSPEAMLIKPVALSELITACRAQAHA
jgi:DNA-binding NarL/FixJ family response regulator